MRLLAAAVVLAGCVPFEETWLPTQIRERSYVVDTWVGSCFLVACPKPALSAPADFPNQYGLGCTCYDSSTCREQRLAANPQASVPGCGEVPAWPAAPIEEYPGYSSP